MIFISPTATVKGHAHVYGNAQVSDYAIVEGQSILEGDVTISSGHIRDLHWWKDVP